MNHLCFTRWCFFSICDLLGVCMTEKEEKNKNIYRKKNHDALLRQKKRNDKLPVYT